MIYSSLHIFSFPSLLVFVGEGIGMPLPKFGFVSVQEGSNIYGHCHIKYLKC